MAWGGGPVVTGLASPDGPAPTADAPATGAVDAVARAGTASVLGLLRGVTMFRSLALVWALTGVVSSTAFLRRPALAVALVTLMVVWTGLVALWPRRGPVLAVLSPWVIGAELVIGAALLLGDGFVYDERRSISLPWSWPAAGAMTAGVVYGWRAGLAAALALAMASLVTEFRLDRNVSEPIQAFSRIGLWVVVGVLAGYVSSRLRRAETELAEARSQAELARAREEVARRLHDGVLQTLAVIQRRSDDADLAALARDQEVDLRRFLAGSGERPVALEPELRRLARRHERQHPGTVVRVVVGPDAPEPGGARLEAVLGAVGEALTNVGKHAGATTVTIFADLADADDLPPTELDLDAAGQLRRGAGSGTARLELFVTVKDDGRGFDPATVTERIGLARSIRGRITEVGGRAEIVGRPERGVEVKLWV